MFVACADAGVVLHPNRPIASKTSHATATALRTLFAIDISL
jgi:hypothetical protein